MNEIHNDFLITGYLNLLQRVLSAKKLVKQIELPLRKPLFLHQDDQAYYRVLSKAFDKQEIESNLTNLRFDFVFFAMDDILSDAA